MWKYGVIILTTICLLSCEKRVSIDNNFNVHYDSMTRGYKLYFYNESILKHQYCYAIGWNETSIIVKSKNLSQSENSNIDDESFSYYIINRYLMAEKFDGQIQGPFSYSNFLIELKKKSLDDLSFTHNFDRKPIINLN